MDLLATVRKEGSRGGQGDFKWSDVQNSTRREHYLGHSLMAPVGRWSKGRDLNWYAKADKDGEDGEDPAQKAERERKEEIQRIKQAEEDAIARALGLPVPDRSNANLEPVSDKREADKVQMQAAPVDQTSRGDDAESQDKELRYALKEYKRRHVDDVVIGLETEKEDNLAIHTEIVLRSVATSIALGQEVLRAEGNDDTDIARDHGRNRIIDPPHASSDEGNILEHFGAARSRSACLAKRPEASLLISLPHPTIKPVVEDMFLYGLASIEQRCYSC